MSPSRLLPCLLIAVLLAAGPAAAKKDKPPADLAAKYLTWLEEVELLISDEERQAFYQLEQDYQRDGFIRHFWQARDPVPDTEENEFKVRWYARLDYARENFGGLDVDERARFLLLNGVPDEVDEGPICPNLFLPIHFWFYGGVGSTARHAAPFALVFYRRGRTVPFRLWYPVAGIHGLLAVSDVEFWENCPRAKEIFFSDPNNNNVFEAKLEDQMLCFLEQVDRRCPGEADRLKWIFSIAAESKGLHYMAATARLQSPIDARDDEWLRTFASASTDLPAGAATFPAELEVRYPGRRGQRTAVQGVLTVAVADVASAELAGRESYNFLLTGEVLRQGELFESFRYRFDFPGAEVAASLPMTFQRWLRPGEFELVLKLEDVHSQRFARLQHAITVPRVERTAAADFQDEDSARLFAEAAAALSERRSSLHLLQPDEELLAGMVRFEATSQGLELAKVTFYLDGEKVLAKRRPPYSVEMDLGPIPRLHVVEAVGTDEDGEVAARDRIEINRGQNRFAVRLREPRPGSSYRRSLLARAEVDVPDSETLDRVELYLGERRVATLYQPPFEQAIVLDGGDDLTFVRATAYLADGNATEDVVLINAPAGLQEIDVQLVELYVSALDDRRRPVADLAQSDFTVVEDGAPQQLLRFEKVQDLPIHAGILFDASTSMEDKLDQARAAALGFFERIITPRDRAAVVTFSDRPNLVVKFTNQIDALAAEMAGVRAEGSTALWDSVVFTLQYFNGVKGQRAILLLTDGKDESSRFEFKDALSYAQTTAVTFYTVGLGLGKAALDTRHKLSKLADATGGRSYFIQEAAELEAIYAQIEQELRSKYFLAYQSSNATAGNDEFRAITVRVARPGVEVKTRPGYFP